MDLNGVLIQLNSLEDNLEETNELKRVLEQAVRVRFKEEDIKKIMFAYKCALDFHRGQRRKSGEPYIIHPINVALIALTEMHLCDVDATCAELLHDTVEDTDVSLEMLSNLFNKDVAFLVDGVSKFKDLNFASKTEEGQYNDCKLLRNSANDMREIAIKLADRLHNMRTLIFHGSKEQINTYKALKNPEKDIKEMVIHSTSKQLEKSVETYVLFAPLADRIGASKVRDELLDLSFMYLQNDKYRKYNGYLTNFQKRYEHFLTVKELEISQILDKKHIMHDISFKLKSPFSFYTEIRRSRIKSQRGEDLPGFINLEIITDLDDDCEKVLNILRETYGEDKLEDYITLPKTNGYSAYHLYTKFEKGFNVCFKICTRRMKFINDYGICSLTEMYPEMSMQDIQKSLSFTNDFVASLQSIESLAKDNSSFLKWVKEELLSKQIEVISKDGKKSYSLPRGASVLDFAYKIHSEVGDQAIGAYINNHRVGIDHILSDGDQVVVMKNRLQTCQPISNLAFVITYTARKKIKEGANKAKKQDNYMLERKLSQSSK